MGLTDVSDLPTWGAGIVAPSRSCGNLCNARRRKTNIRRSVLVRRMESRPELEDEQGVLIRNEHGREFNMTAPSALDCPRQ